MAVPHDNLKLVESFEVITPITLMSETPGSEHLINNKSKISDHPILKMSFRASLVNNKMRMKLNVLRKDISLTIFLQNSPRMTFLEMQF